MYFAHRGLHTKDKAVPENSLAAFTAAVDAGYGIELDIRLAADGEVVVFHDYTLLRMCGAPGRVADLTLAQLRELKLLDTDQGIPTLWETLYVVKGKVPLLVELKSGPQHKRLCEEAWKILRTYEGDVCIQSFDPRMVRWYKKHVPGLLRGQLAARPKELRASAGLDTISREIVTFNGAASGVLARAQALGSDLEKVQFIHDYLAATVSYVYGDDVYTAYSAIVNRQAVCEGYAKAFSYFMNRLGIPSTYCTGTAGGENHGWSLVRLDGQFYNLDVTWDDPLGLREGDWRYDYFLRSDAEMAATHTRDETSQKLPACTSTRYDDTDWDVLHGASGADLLRLAA